MRFLKRTLVIKKPECGVNNNRVIHLYIIVIRRENTVASMSS